MLELKAAAIRLKLRVSRISMREMHTSAKLEASEQFCNLELDGETPHSVVRTICLVSHSCSLGAGAVGTELGAVCLHGVECGERERELGREELGVHDDYHVLQVGVRGPDREWDPRPRTGTHEADG